MNTKTIRLLVSAAMISGVASAVVAADEKEVDLGKQEFKAKCAVCHGVSGKGDGSVVELLKTAPSDLTMLSKKNGGVFPFEHVYGVIDGRAAVKLHGEREMPIWGKDYSTDSLRASEYYVDMPHTMEMHVRARILALIDYLSRIQEE